MKRKTNPINHFNLHYANIETSIVDSITSISPIQKKKKKLKPPNKPNTKLKSPIKPQKLEQNNLKK